ncbi:MAG: SUMF1/EgtB/PvdO family nonheme iron enzyme [Desulfamplus sp.]|nr:SUMF1/EgtB/PvdO family nonheme iron enzyme [Desulfamplus sp.]
MNPETMCMGCMTDKKSSTPVCPLCGYDEGERRSPLVLKHRTLLADQYVVGKVLGKPGGFGITYLGWDTRLETMVAIKEYLPRDNAGRDTDQTTVVAHSKEDEELFRFGLEAFLMEARTLAKFKHANVVRVVTFFEANNTAYLVMDYYDGMSLEHYLIEKGGRIAEKLAIDIMMPILDGLREVHEKGFLHRDIKPQNIYLTQGGLPILLDFGAARFVMGERSRSLTAMMTAGYAPYEQYNSKGRQGSWTDIYACGATLYRMVTGKVPPAAMDRIQDDDLIPPDRFANVSLGFQNAVMQALSVNSAERPQSVRQFQDILLNLSEASSAEPAPNFQSTPPPPNFQSPPPLQPEPEFQTPEPPYRPTPQPIPPISQSSRSEPPPPLPTQQPQQKSGVLKWVVIGLVVIAGIFIAYSMGGKKQSYQSSVSTEPVSSNVEQLKPAKQPEPAPEPSPPVITKREPQAGDIIDGSLPNMQFAYIPPGEFMMGSPADEPDRSDDESRHRVKLTKGFYMQTTEVTRGHWQSFVAETHYKTEAETGGGVQEWDESGEGIITKPGDWLYVGFSQTNSHPVTCISWNDIQKFLEWLNQKDNKLYHLPTEAEWEYACRAGTTTPFNTGKCLSTDEANYDGSNYPLDGCSKGNYKKTTLPVGSFSSNKWGLYDMHGNVSEWCSDWDGGLTDVGVEDSSCCRIIRGGGWNISASGCRAASREIYNQSYRNVAVGFRLVLPAGQQ